MAGYANGNWAMSRYNSNGTIDTSFGVNGNVATDMGSAADQALNLHVQPDGKLLLLGLTAGGTANYHFALARYNADGSLDTTFGSGGKLLTGLGRAPTFGCVAVILGDGRIHVTGWLNGTAKAMEYDTNGKNGFDRLANKPALLRPLSAPIQGQSHPLPGTLDYYALSPFVGPTFPDDESFIMTPQDIHVVEAGAAYSITLPVGKSRVVDWGDGSPPTVASDGADTATHIYSTAGSYIVRTDGYLSSVPLPYEFAQEHKRVLAADLSMAGGMSIDLNTNDLYLGATSDGAPTDSFSTIQQYVFNGYGTHNDSLPQIRSSDSRATEGYSILALFDNALLGLSEWPSGHPISSHAIVGQYTYYGDTNLDGMVKAQDYTATDANLGTSNDLGVSWFYGDTNLDGNTDATDYTAIDGSLGNGDPENTSPILSLHETLVSTEDIPLSIASPLNVEDSPATPTNLSISSLTSESLKLTWDDNSRSEVGYRIEMSENNGYLAEIANWASASPNDTGRRSWRISDLNPGRNYVFRLFPDGITHENTNFADISVTTPTDRSLYAEDFTEGIWNEWSSNRSTTLTNVASEPSADRFLGPFGSASGTVNLSLANVPAGKLNISFDLYVMGAWDGDDVNGAHKWELTEGMNNLLAYSFANRDSTNSQSFPDEYGLGAHGQQFEADAKDTLGGMSSAIYHISKTFMLGGSSLLLHFATEHLGVGETWGIDNVVISERGSGASGPSTVEEGEPYTLDLSDLEGDVANWTIDWGDAQTSTPTGSTDSLEHAFSGNLGSYTIHPSADGQSLPNISVSVIPALPDSLDFTPLSTGVNLTWRDNSRVEQNYVVQESANEDFTSPSSQTLSSDTTAYPWNGLSPRSTHYFRIGAKKGSTISWSASYVLAKTSAALTTIATIGAAPKSSSEVIVTWTDTDNTGVGHDVQRYDGGSFVTVATLEAGITSYTDWNLSEGQQYMYRVRANNAFETGTESSTSSAYTLPATPGYLVAFAQSATSVSLQWPDSSVHETGYVVERSVNGTSWTAVTGSPFAPGTTATTATSLSVNTPYFFRVYATGPGSQNSGYATASEQTPVAGELPAPPQVELSHDTNSATLTWSAGVLATGFLVDRKDGIDGMWSNLTSTTSPSFSQNSLAGNRTFYYRVTGFDIYGNGAPSDEVAFSTGVSTPTGLSAITTDSGAVELTWNDTSANETGFQIVEVIAGAEYELQEVPYQSGTGSVTSTLFGLSQDIAHEIIVKAITPSEASSNSASATVTPNVQGITAESIGNPFYDVDFKLLLTTQNLSGGPINWSIDWGDGTSVTEFTSTGGISPPHPYANPGDGREHTFSILVSAANAADGKLQATVFKVTPTVSTGGGMTLGSGSVSASAARKIRKQFLGAFTEIYNTVQYEPYMGAKKGLKAVAQTKKANDWDQAALLASQLKQIWNDDRLEVRYVLWTSPRMVGATKGSIMAVNGANHGTTEVHARVQSLSGQAGQRAGVLDPRSGQKSGRRSQLRARLGR